MFDETDLYPPIKSFLEAQGCEVKAEINSCDVVAKKPDGSVIIIELKKGFNLDLLIQGVERLSLAGPIAKGSVWNKRRRGILKLCKRLGLGLMMVNLFAHKDPKVLVLLDPTPYDPRKNLSKVMRLKKEFNSRIGDPNKGGSTTRTKIMTSYRQSAILCAKLLSNSGPMQVKGVRDLTGVEKAGNLMRNNHYGWFKKIKRGVYELTEKGKNDLPIYFKD